jgi:phage-related protein
MEREIIFYKEYFLEFYHQQDEKVQEKIAYVFDLIRYEQRVPSSFLKHLEGTDKLYEIRIKVGSNIYRIFCFFDKGKLVVLLNGFQKKSQKTPTNELKLAEKLKKEYYEKN